MKGQEEQQNLEQKKKNCKKIQKRKKMLKKKETDSAKNIEIQTEKEIAETTEVDNDKK